MNQAERALIVRDPTVMSGTPVFAGTRVPVATLFNHLKHGTVEDFVAEFPTVTREQALEVLLLAGKRLMDEVA